jgi:hypothetical protein
MREKLRQAVLNDPIGCIRTRLDEPGLPCIRIIYFYVMNIEKFIHAFMIFTVASAYLAGCEKSGSKNPLVDNSVVKYSQAVTLSGSVSGRKGPLQAGRIEAASGNGSMIASARLESGSRYTLVIPAGTPLPVVLKAYPDNGRSGEAMLEAVAVDPALKKYDINPLSTAIAEKARSLGGYSRENMLEAAMTSVTVPDANKTIGGFRGDPTKQYGGWH